MLLFFLFAHRWICSWILQLQGTPLRLFIIFSCPPRINVSLDRRLIVQRPRTQCFVPSPYDAYVRSCFVIRLSVGRGVVS